MQSTINCTVGKNRSQVQKYAPNRDHRSRYSLKKLEFLNSGVFGLFTFFANYTIYAYLLLLGILDVINIYDIFR